MCVIPFAVIGSNITAARAGAAVARALRGISHDFQVAVNMQQIQVHVGPIAVEAHDPHRGALRECESIEELRPAGRTRGLTAVAGKLTANKLSQRASIRERQTVDLKRILKRARAGVPMGSETKDISSGPPAPAAEPAPPQEAEEDTEVEPEAEPEAEPEPEE